MTLLLENFPHLLNSTTLWQELLVHRVLMDQYLHSNSRGFSRGKTFYSAAILKHIWYLDGQFGQFGQLFGIIGHEQNIQLNLRKEITAFIQERKKIELGKQV